MKYRSYEMADKLPAKMKATLVKAFPTGNFGVSVLFDKDNSVYLVTIHTVVRNGEGINGNGETWTHLANIQLWDDMTWEVNTQFNGKNEDEMWIYGYYKRFGDAVNFVAANKMKNQKPIKIWM